MVRKMTLRAEKKFSADLRGFFCSAWPDHNSGMVEFLFSHQSFPLAPIDANITRARISHRTIEGEFIPNEKNT